MVPILNEERYLAATVHSIVNQDHGGEFEIALVHGPSTDGTAGVLAQLVAADPSIMVIDNPSGKTPVSMNLGIAATTHPVVVRVDAHSELPQGYTRTLVAALADHGAVNAGGRMMARGESPYQRAVAWAYNSPVGLGGGAHHGGGEERAAETVYLGVFRRDALEAVGGYDETLDRAQDWELNRRLREAGGILWFVPSVEVDYLPRSSWRTLTRQFWMSGRWRATLIREDPRNAPLRHLAPPVATVVGLVALVAGVAVAARGFMAVGAAIALAGPAVYVLGVIFVAAGARGLTPTSRAWLAAVLPTMHASWGAGSLVGLVKPMRQRHDSALAGDHMAIHDTRDEG